MSVKDLLVSKANQLPASLLIDPTTVEGQFSLVVLLNMNTVHMKELRDIVDGYGENRVGILFCKERVSKEIVRFYRGTDFANEDPYSEIARIRPLIPSTDGHDCYYSVVIEFKQ